MMKWGSSFSRAFYNLPEVGGTVAVTCPICGIHTHATIVYRDTTPASKHVQLPISDMKVYNYLLKCTQCASSILLLWSFKDDRFIDERYSAGRRMYPFPTSIANSEILDGKIVPAAICEDLRQAELSNHAGAYRGAGLLLRSACQNICRDKGAIGKNLKEEIMDIAGKGFINKALAEMVDCVRLLGNEIAHPDPSSPFETTSDDVIACREFIDQMLDAIYIGPYKAQRLKERLGK